MRPTRSSSTGTAAGCNASRSDRSGNPAGDPARHERKRSPMVLEEAGAREANGRYLVAPRVAPPLDPAFRPAVLARHALDLAVRGTPGARSVALAVEQPGGSVLARETHVFEAGHPDVAVSYAFCERLLKSMLWSHGGSRIWVDGPPALVESLRHHYEDEPDRPVRRADPGRRGLPGAARGPGRGPPRLPGHEGGGIPPRAAPGRLPDRVRPRGERPEGRCRDRRHGRVQRGDRLGPDHARRSRAGTSTRSMTRSGARRPTFRGSTRSAGARLASTSTARSGSRRSSGPSPGTSSTGGSGACSASSGGPGTGSRSWSSTTGR